ncbi:MAG: NADP-dependent oxidoreductase [Cellvibrionales bacterium]|nr:NADP-dependent oxidoreductase [Cellvibrionales bacterium]
MRKNTQVKLAACPEGIPEPQNFLVADAEMPVASPGQVLVQTLYLSLDPYMRSQIAGRHVSAAISVGELMRGETIGRVVESQCADFAAGDIVRCMGGWQNYSVHSPAQLNPVAESKVDPACFLSALGMPGLTAYAGLILQAQPKEGDTVVIPAAVGGVGSMAGQLAKIHGCRVIGIVGSEEKRRYALEELGYDHCINRKTEDISERLKKLCPQGIDIYFDLVGGSLLNLVSAQLAVGARVILCGLMEDYNSPQRQPGPPPALWIVARARIHGLVVYDFEPRRPEFIERCLPYVQSGQIQFRHDIGEGLASAPESFCRLMRGENCGKTLVRCAHG